MSEGLRTLLKLPEAQVANRTGPAQQFGQAFRTRLERVNQKLRVTAAQASPDTQQPLEGQRLRLIEAFQKTAAQIDSAEPNKARGAIKRVIAAIDLVEGKAEEAVTSAAAGRDGWQEREGELDDALVQIGELEEAGHPKAATLRKLGDAIRSRANSRNYHAATTALDQLLPKLDALYVEHLQQQLDQDEAHPETPEQGPEEGREENRQETPDRTGGALQGLTVLVRDAASGDAVEGAAVQVGDQTDTTSSHGLATLELPLGSHDWRVTAVGYETVSEAIDVIDGDNPELVVELTACPVGPREGLTVFVKDSTTGDVVQDVTVTVGDQSDITTANGLATVELSVGTHRWEAVSADYATQSGDVEIIAGDNPELLIELIRAEAGRERPVADASRVGLIDPSMADGDLTDELSDAQRFVDVWNETLNDVADQVDRLRDAMADCDDFGISTVRDGLATVMDKFPDLDLSKLLDAARTNNREAYDKTLQQTAREVREVRDLLANGPLLSTIDENPFVHTSVHARVTGVLDEIVDELGISEAL
jgi:hypothetical protein